MLRLLGCWLVVLLSASLLLAQDPPTRGGKKGGRAKADAKVKADAMPYTGLSPAKMVPNLCIYSYRVSTLSPECQALCDQALGYYYSYVWMEAARSFETALKHDPECAMAWLGLYRAMEKWGRGSNATPNTFLGLAGAAFQPKIPDRFGKSARDYALEMAKQLMPKANHREQLLIQAKLQEKGMWPNTPADERRKKAQATLDELLTLYDDDEEGWFARAQLGDGQYGGAPFYKSLLKVNPLHPGANHEFVHFYENIRRPALGWTYAENYMKSSPSIPHAFHMQAHLATRVGKWKDTTSWSWRAVELEREYHKFQSVSPADDHQFYHHMEILTKSLVHDGRFVDAQKIKTEALSHNYNFRTEWFRMALMQQDWDEANKIISFYRKSDKFGAAYHSALMAIHQKDIARASAEMDVMRQVSQTNKSNRSQEMRLWEVQGYIMCLTGQGEAGVKLLRRTVEKTKDDFSHHSWGGGAYYMEIWGTAALEAGLATEAEEGFQEALAHDSGSVRAALGMWALCHRLGRVDEAARYLKVARRCWANANPDDLVRLRDDFAKRAENVPSSTIATNKGE